MRNRTLTIVLVVLTVAVLLISAPASLGEAYRRGGFYLFSRDFLEDIPKRLGGPGRFRFFVQPLVALILGVRSGRDDARAGRPPYIYGIFFDSAKRKELLATGLSSILNVVLMGILLDSLFQWALFGVSYPGAALVVGPVLIGIPYALARALSNRVARSGKES